MNRGKTAEILKLPFLTINSPMAQNMLACQTLKKFQLRRMH